MLGQWADLFVARGDAAALPKALKGAMCCLTYGQGLRERRTSVQSRAAALAALLGFRLLLLVGACAELLHVHVPYTWPPATDGSASVTLCMGLIYCTVHALCMIG